MTIGKASGSTGKSMPRPRFHEWAAPLKQVRTVICRFDVIRDLRLARFRLDFACRILEPLANAGQCQNNIDLRSFIASGARSNSPCGSSQTERDAPNPI